MPACPWSRHDMSLVIKWVPPMHVCSLQELAWASYALLRNTNCCGVVMVREGHVLLARGALGSEVVTAGNAAASLAAMSKVRVYWCP